VGAQPHQLSDDQLAVVLALRGLLACNLLQHCLQKRHQVDYGVNRCGGVRWVGHWGPMCDGTAWGRERPPCRGKRVGAGVDGPSDEP
jgi:hypothetical protein